jgi:response regulator RpfG family c-di-GMP phosphodiesterase
MTSSPTSVPTRPALEAASVLLVDDEVAILDGLRRQLRKRYTVHTATGGAEALEFLKSEQVAVVVSDMRMPQMNGAAFLAQVRSLYPDVVRILLTGQADTQAAIMAVNEGQIYRFLTKPCPPEVLLEEIGGAVEHNRLVTAEKELLATTLRRTVEALIETLSLAQPAAFGRAVRISRTVTELAEALGIEEPWQLEVTAMLSQIGAVTLPPNVLQKLDTGRPLNEDEQEMADRVSEISRKLVSGIPRLEDVAEAIGWQRVRFDGRNSPLGAPSGADLPLGARFLRIAVDFDLGTSQRPAVHDTLAAMGADRGAYDLAILDALTALHATTEPEDKPQEIDLDDLEPGMVIFDDILTTDGVLLIGRGTTVTDPLILRLENYISQNRVARRMRVSG